MSRTLDEWIYLNRPEGWIESESTQFQAKVGDPREMCWAWGLGARRFGKIPIVRAKIAKTGHFEGKTQKVGPVRSLVDPEPPPEGGEFILAWHDGISWCDRFDEFYVDPFCESLENRDAFERMEKESGERVRKFRSEANESALKRFEQAVEEGAELFEPFGSNIDRLPRLLSEGKIELVLAIAYSAGMVAGKAETLRSMRGLLERDDKRKRNTDWADVVADALARHGKDLSPVNLLKRMQGVRRRTNSTWDFPGGDNVDQAKFEAAFKAANKRGRHRTQPIETTLLDR